MSSSFFAADIMNDDLKLFLSEKKNDVTFESSHQNVCINKNKSKSFKVNTTGYIQFLMLNSRYGLKLNVYIVNTSIYASLIATYN